MDAIVLVGGEGTRLRPLTYTTPKQLLPLIHKRLIEHVLSPVSKVSISRLVLSMGYKPEKFYEAFPENTICTIEATYVVEDEPLDTGGAISFAYQEAGLADRVVVLNGDVINGIDLSQLLEKHEAAGATISIALVPVADPSRFGVVLKDDCGRVSDFIEKPPKENAPSNLINAGIYILEPEAFRYFKGKGRHSVEREVFPAAAADSRLYAFEFNDYWLDTGTPESYLLASKDVLLGKCGDFPKDKYLTVESSFVSKSATFTNEDALTGHCFVGDDSKLFAANLVNSFIYSRCVIEENSKIEKSAIFDQCQVGEHATIVDSILGYGCKVGEGATVHNCVIGDGYEVPAFSTFKGEKLR